MTEENLEKKEESQETSGLEESLSETPKSAIVNGEKLTDDEMNNIKQAVMQQGITLTDKDLLEQAINQKLLLQELQKSGIEVSSEEAESTISAQLTQQGASLDQYKEQLEKMNVSYEKDLERVKEQMKIQKFFQSKIDDKNLEVGDEEIAKFYEMFKTQAENIPPLEDIKEQVIVSIKQQKHQVEVSKIISELREKADIKYE